MAAVLKDALKHSKQTNAQKHERALSTLSSREVYKHAVVLFDQVAKETPSLPPAIGYLTSPNRESTH